MTERWLPLIGLLILSIALGRGCAAVAQTSTTRPTTQRAKRPTSGVQGLCIKYVWGGGFTGEFHTLRVATPDVAIENGDEEVTRVSGEKAQAIVDLLRREGVMDWPQGIHGRGEWHDNYHYFLDLTMDGATHTIHASDGPTADEAERLQKLMKKIEATAEVERKTGQTGDSHLFPSRRATKQVTVPSFSTPHCPRHRWSWLGCRLGRNAESDWIGNGDFLMGGIEVETAFVGWGCNSGRD